MKKWTKLNSFEMANWLSRKVKDNRKNKNFSLLDFINEVVYLLKRIIFEGHFKVCSNYRVFKQSLRINLQSNVYGWYFWDFWEFISILWKKKKRIDLSSIIVVLIYCTYKALDGVDKILIMDKKCKIYGQYKEE